MEHDTTLLVKIHPNILGVNASSIYFLLWQKCFWSPTTITSRQRLQYTSGHLPETQMEKKERIYDEHINSFSSTEKIGNTNGLLGFQPALMFSPKLIFSEFLCNILESHSST